MSAKDGQSYAETLKVMKARVNPSDAGLEVMTLQRTQKHEILLVLEKVGKLDLGIPCRLYKHFKGVQTAVVRLSEADA